MIGTPAPTATTKAAYETCLSDDVLGPVLRLASSLLDEGLQSTETGTVVGAAFYGAGASEAGSAGDTAERVTALVRGLRHLGLETSDIANIAGDVFSRRIA